MNVSSRLVERGHCRNATFALAASCIWAMGSVMSRSRVTCKLCWITFRMHFWIQRRITRTQRIRIAFNIWTFLVNRVRRQRAGPSPATSAVKFIKTWGKCRRARRIVITRTTTWARRRCWAAHLHRTLRTTTRTTSGSSIMGELHVLYCSTFASLRNMKNNFILIQSLPFPTYTPLSSRLIRQLKSFSWNKIKY